MRSGGAIGAGYFVATGSALATGGPGSLVTLCTCRWMFES